MRRVLPIAVVTVWLVAAGVLIGFALESWIGDDAPATPATLTLKELLPQAPQAVEETRLALIAAAESGDNEAVRALIPTEGGFTYTFGGPVEGGPIAYWQELERTTDERPLETLAAILKMPYVLSRGVYVWPRAYTATSAADLSPSERELLAPLGKLKTLFVPGTGYLGWRAGIAPDGSWVFFVAGD